MFLYKRQACDDSVSSCLTAKYLRQGDPGNPGWRLSSGEGRRELFKLIILQVRSMHKLRVVYFNISTDRTADIIHVSTFLQVLHGETGPKDWGYWGWVSNLGVGQSDSYHLKAANLIFFELLL